MSLAPPWLIRTRLTQGPPGVGGAKLSGNVAWTPGTIANGGNASVAVPVAGALVGQSAVGGFTVGVPGVQALVSVTAPGIATLTLLNLSGAGFTPGAGTAWVDVLVH